MDYFPDNITFSVVVNTIFSKFFITPDGDIKGERIFGNFRSLIVQGWKARFKHLSSADERELGKIVDAKSVIGITEMVKTGKADIGLVYVNTLRIEEVDLSEPFTEISYTFTTDLPQALSKAYSYIYPFDVESWLCILLSFFVVTVLIYIINKRSTTFSQVLLSTFGNLFSHADIQMLHDRTYLEVIWRFFCFLIPACYAGVLLSFLTIPRFEKPVTNFRELAGAIKEGKYCAYTIKGSFINHLLKTSGKEHLVYIERMIEENQWCYQNRENPMDGIKRAMVTIRPVAYLYYGEPPLSTKYVSEDNEFTVPSSLPVNKKFCCKKDLDLVIRRINYSGLYKKLNKDELFKIWIKHHSLSRKDGEPLTLNDLCGAFYVLVIGYLISFLVFVHELLKGKLRNSLQ